MPIGKIGGSLPGAKHKTVPNNVRFWKYVRTSDDCWIWVGAKRDGYGVLHATFGQHNYKNVVAHRFAYELLIGPIPNGKVLDHIECNNRACVNPGHLNPCTSKVNILRGVSPSALNSRKTYCKHGHPLIAENMRIRKLDGSRVCRPCERIRIKKRRLNERLIRKN